MTVKADVGEVLSWSVGFAAVWWLTEWELWDWRPWVVFVAFGVGDVVRQLMRRMR